jgi:hypothetical protein
MLPEAARVVTAGMAILTSVLMLREPKQAMVVGPRGAADTGGRDVEEPHRQHEHECTGQE